MACGCAIQGGRNRIQGGCCLCLLVCTLLQGACGPGSRSPGLPPLTGPFLLQPCLCAAHSSLRVCGLAVQPRDSCSLAPECLPGMLAAKGGGSQLGSCPACLQPAAVVTGSGHIPWATSLSTGACRMPTRSPTLPVGWLQMAPAPTPSQCQLCGPGALCSSVILVTVSNAHARDASRAEPLGRACMEAVQVSSANGLFRSLFCTNGL